MNPDHASNNQSIQNHVFLNGKQLAEVLDVAPPSLSEAVKKGYNCAGYPVCEWAVETDSGRIKGYEVPEFLVSGDESTLEKRANPTENVPNEANNNPNKGPEPASQVQEVIQNYSLLAKGEDYVRPAGMVSLPLVLKKALDKDTPHSRAVISVISTLLGAITGHAVADNAKGAVIGAGAGFGITLLMYTYFNPGTGIDHQPALQEGVAKHKLDFLLAQKANNSGYVPN